MVQIYNEALSWTLHSLFDVPPALSVALAPSACQIGPLSGAAVNADRVVACPTGLTRPVVSRSMGERIVSILRLGRSWPVVRGVIDSRSGRTVVGRKSNLPGIPLVVVSNTDTIEYCRNVARYDLVILSRIWVLTFDNLEGMTTSA